MSRRFDCNTWEGASSRALAWISERIASISASLAFRTVKMVVLRCISSNQGARRGLANALVLSYFLMASSEPVCRLSLVLAVAQVGTNLFTIQAPVSLQCHPLKAIFITVFLQRSEEHTSELQSRGHLVCRLLRAKK